MTCLGGLSPYEVVTGLKPRVPGSLVTEVKGSEMPVTEYVAMLKPYLAELHGEIVDLKKSEIEKFGEQVAGKVSQELHLGDFVLVRRGKSQQPEAGGPTPGKFQKKVYDGIFRVSRKVSPMSYYVERASDTLKPIKFGQPVNADRLVKFDLPMLGLEDRPRYKLEIFEDDVWVVYTVVDYGRDGQVRLEGRKGLARWHDLSGLRYRWIDDRV